MRLFTSLIATTAILFAASSASAAVSFVVAGATTGDGSPLSAVTPGTTLTLDIEFTTSAPMEMISIGASVNDWDPSIATQNAGASVVPLTVLNTACFPSFGCVGGITQVETQLKDSGIEGFPGTNGTEATFLSILGFAGAGGDGSVDIADSGPQFSVVFDISPTATGSTTFRVGTFADYADEYNGATDSIVNNDSVSITIVPEPGTALLMGLGLAGLAAAGRRE